jgi:hypothetical protein
MGSWWFEWRARRAEARASRARAKAGAAERRRQALAEERQAEAEARAADRDAKDEGRDVSGLLTIALQVLGVSAGLAALAALAGGAMMWIRFDDLDLPADRAVALLPNELLVVVGAQALLTPLLVGVGVLVLLILLDPLDDGRIAPWRFWFLMAVLVGVAAYAIWWLEDDLNWEGVAIMVALTALLLAAIVSTAVRTDRVRFIAWVLFGAAAIFSAAVAIAETKADPRMEPVAMVLRAEPPGTPERGIAGFFVGESTDRVYFVSLPGNADPGDPFADQPVDRVVSVARDEVARMAIREPIGTDAARGGRDLAYHLLAELRQSMRPAEEAGKAEPVVTLHPEVAFAPLVHLHAKETAFPMSARGFIDRSELRWAHDSDCDDALLAVGSKLPGASAGTIDDAKLGREPAYRWAPRDPECRPLPTEFAATDRTRPFDAKRARRDGRDLELHEGFYLDLDDDALHGRDDVDESGSQRFLRNVPVYVETRPDELGGRRRVGARRYMRLTYWFLYGDSQPPPGRPRGLSKLIAHEGDWERISVLVLHAPGSDRYEPVSVRYHFHDDSRDVPWHAVRRVEGDGADGSGLTHPVVYSARGSHASYPRSGRHATPYQPQGKEYFVVYDDAIACSRCPQWQTWKQLVDARAQLWYGFGGAWGRVRGTGFMTGPIGPSDYKIGRREGPPTKTLGSKPPVPTAPPALQEQAAE